MFPILSQFAPNCPSFHRNVTICSLFVETRCFQLQSLQTCKNPNNPPFNLEDPNLWLPYFAENRIEIVLEVRLLIHIFDINAKNFED